MRSTRRVLGWALTYGLYGLFCAVRGTPLFWRGPHPGPAALDWAVVAVAAVAGLGALTARRGVLLAGCALAAAGAFGLLMEVIVLLTGEQVDSWPAAGQQALAAVGTLLLWQAVRERRPAAPTRLSGWLTVRRPRLLAAVGTVCFVPYVVMKLTWATGGTFAGASGAEMVATARRNGASGIWLTLESWGLDVTALLAALGVVLLWGLVRPWGEVFPRWLLGLAGRRVPRWLPLTPAVLGAATLAPYGVVGSGYLLLTMVGALPASAPGDFHTVDNALLAGWIGIGAFGVYGVSLALAARAYWLRTR